jgi:hypothetical protein
VTVPIIKPISGHTGCAGVMRYLEKDGRALAVDYLNLPAPEIEPGAELPSYLTYDWAREMDATRAAAGNDIPWRGMRVRTYKHYVLSPDPGDRIELDDLRRLTMAWVRENFDDYEVAVVYHDDNAGRIPHAHVVVNNTNIRNMLRLQDPEPRALKRSVQQLAKEAGLSYLKDAPAGDAPPHRTLQRCHMRRAESELKARGEYSWVADIRSRVEIARAVARDAGDFKELLGAMGIDVSDNSEKAAVRDWIFALSDSPSRKVAGESLGLSYGRERLLARFSSGASILSSSGSRAIAEVAEKAVRVGDLDELRDLAAAVSFIDTNRIRSLEQLREALEGSPAMGEKILPLAERIGMLPEHAKRLPARKPANKEPSAGRGGRLRSRGGNAAQPRREQSPPLPSRQDRPDRGQR